MSEAQKTVVVGMSGGVDSSVSALLLKQQGYQVIGLFMKNWEETNPLTGACTSAQDFEDVEQVCTQLDIPFYGINFVKEYQTLVFAEFLQELRMGFTPNPDILCNKWIKFDVFLQKAKEVGADFIATGHYCQTDGVHLLKGKDPQKDQSYFLHAIAGHTLEKVLFPIGGMEKTEVRRIAQEHGLPVFNKKDSTGICFIGERNFTKFLSQYIPMKPGEFRTLNETVVGKHCGTCFYTIGQRRHLGLGGPGPRWFVVAKNVERNIVYVEQGEHPLLFSRELCADRLSWIAGVPPQFPLRCRAKIRYRQADQDCTIEIKGEGKLHVRFDVAQRAITPGQAVVFYQGEICLGGGVIF
jgi:tRNA-specific 2-thiouridylase